MRKVQPGEGQSEPGANPFVAVQVKLSEGVFHRRGEDPSENGCPRSWTSV
jgi:hypothetical protein